MPLREAPPFWTATCPVELPNVPAVGANSRFECNWTFVIGQVLLRAPTLKPRVKAASRLHVPAVRLQTT